MKINSHSAALSALIFSLSFNTSSVANSPPDLVHDENSPSLARVSTLLLQPGLPESHVSGDLLASSHLSPNVSSEAKGEKWLGEEEWEGYGEVDTEKFNLGFRAKTSAEEMEKMKALSKTEKDWEDVGGAGRVLPSAETTLQRTSRRLTDTVLFAGKLALPFVATRLTNVGINLVFDKLEPSVTNFMAQRSAESGSRDAAYITTWIPGGDFLVRLAYDQIMRDEVSLRIADTRGFLLNYGTALFEGISLTTSSVWSGFKSWFRR